MSMGLKDAEAKGGDQWEQQEQEQATITRAKQLPFAFDLRLSQIPDNCQQIAVRFRRANGIREFDRERSIWWLRWGNRCIRRA